MRMKVLVLGATGMLGHAVLGALVDQPGIEPAGAVRSAESAARLPARLRPAARILGDLTALDTLRAGLDATRPDVVVNCTSLAKADLQDPLKAFTVYSLLPRRLAQLCRDRAARLVQVSSDGVFSGSRGQYTERDLPDAADVYGAAKLLGEVDGPGAVTLRTSMVGHELGTRAGLLEWFLAQQGSCRCFDRAVFSGLPTVELAAIVRDVVLPQPRLQGIYHVAAAPISKYELLRRVAKVYGKSIDLVADSSVVIDRSLVAERFRADSGYTAPDWDRLVNIMHASHSFAARV
jgi:dTDP-4-dehydrorhamnose reductase